MIEYEIYKMIHLLMVVLLFSSFAVQCFSDKKSKLHSILAGVASLLLLVSGMGLLARLGVSHTAGWPLWAKGKVAIWAIIAALTPVVIRRFPGFKRSWFWIITLLFVVVTYFAIYKP